MDLVKRMAHGITKGWAKILLHPDSVELLLKIVESLRDKDITPAWEDIFAFAKFSLKRVRAVVIGQDPYPTRGDAQGIAFSTRAKKRPKSLSNIWAALTESKVVLMNPQSNDLTHWCRQGIILINSALTTLVGKSNEHQTLWAPYMTQVFMRMSDTFPVTDWLLWGADAQRKTNLIDPKKHTIHKWCHPVAMVSPSFKHCPHFRMLADKHPELVWEPNMNSTWYTDCSCPNNQNPKLARAAWGVVCTEGRCKGVTMGGRLPALTQIWSEGKEINVRPTNIRGEGTALIEALKKIVDTGVSGAHLVCSDSKFWLDMYDTHIPGWVARGIDFKSRKNSDIVTEFWHVSRLAAQLGMKFKFVNAWHDYTPNRDTQLDWEGNQAAEKEAQKHLKD